MRDLATWLLEDTQGWDRKRLEDAIAKGTTSTARLTHKVPVAWVYFTGWVTRDDVVHFRDDIYDHDGISGRPLVAQVTRPQMQTAARASGFVLQSAEPETTAAIDTPIEQVSYLDSR